MTGSYTVAIYFLVDRLKNAGIEHVLGVPGDYAFKFLDEIGTQPTIKWVGVCNKRNAVYGACGYARVWDMSAITASQTMLTAADACEQDRQRHPTVLGTEGAWPRRAAPIQDIQVSISVRNAAKLSSTYS